MDDDNMYNVLPGEQDNFEEEDAQLRETPSQPTLRSMVGVPPQHKSSWTVLSIYCHHIIVV